MKNNEFRYMSEMKIKKMATRVLMNKYEITQFPEERGIYEFKDMHEAGLLDLEPHFQRKYVWDIKRASELIESFLLGLPIPNVFLYKEKKDGREIRKVLDGVQRITTIIRFFNNQWIDERGNTVEFKLEFRDKGERKEELQYKWQGLRFCDLEQEDKETLRFRTTLRAITIKQENPKDTSSIFYLFERLNTGGVALTTMEIRNCIYEGGLLNKINVLSQNKNFKMLTKKDNNNHTKDSELILRIFALNDNLENHKSSIKDFLNDYCKENRNPSDNWLEVRESLFHKVLNDEKIISFLKAIPKKNDKIIEAIFLIYFEKTKNGETINVPENTDFLKDAELNRKINPGNDTSSKSAILLRVNELKKYFN